MHLVLWADDSETELRSELARSFPGAPVEFLPPALLETEFAVEPGRPLPHLAFARQWLPHARPAQAESVRAWAATLLSSVAGVLPDDQPWRLHIEPHYGIRAAHHIGARAWHTATRCGPGAPIPDPRGVSAQAARRLHLGHGSALRAERRPPVGLRHPNTSEVRTDKRSMNSDTSHLSDLDDLSRPEAGSDTTSQPIVDAAAGRHRCDLVREALIELLQKKRRTLLRQLRPEPRPFAVNESLVQLLLTAPDTGFVSVAAAPLPFEQRHLLSFLPKGAAPAASDKSAPSRAFGKLVEAELRLGRSIRAGETCVDLGASPGSWTYTAANRGARVIAVDHSDLRDDLLRHPRVEFRAGDAFRFAPARPVDWLLCDVIAPPNRTAALLLDWLRRRWCRHFVVTLKMKDTSGLDALELLKRELPKLCREFYLTRLCANKKELCVFGLAVGV